jgi:multidrug efflux pump subunit AcrB
VPGGLAIATRAARRLGLCVAAAESRTRPILLSAAATVLGMIPIAPTVFWGPMAFAVMGGFAAATVLTLLFLPALYVAWFGIREADRARAGAARQPAGAASGLS